MDWLAPILVAMLGSLVRTGLGLLTGVLITHHWLTADQSDHFTAAVVQHLMMWTPLIVAAGWGLLQKYRGRIKLLTAMEMPKGVTEDSVTRAINRGLGASLKSGIVLLLLLLPASAHAQATPIDPNLAWTQHRDAAQMVSNVTVAGSLALDTWASWTASDRRHAFVMQGIRTGAVIGASELIKRLVHRTRPDRSDDLSFWSEHTALSFSAIGGPRLEFAVPLGILTAEGRAGGGKHFLTDTLAGAGVGALAGRFIR